ncbi:COX aromatic rich motif-containing protein [Pseudomonas psychrophila]|uniref:COX aromatic rich motif-containing protein n=1 Tax=Pseudomonas psychrophila TaxID=122355 RepID=UPI0002EECF9E|nr:COX aromatic rich motif-containing protein [Pseudomonas psychrophila]
MKGIITWALVVSALSLPTLAQAALPAETQVYSAGFIDAAGPVAAAQFEHFQTIISLMLIVVVPIFILVPWVLWRYRRGGRGAYRPDWDFNWGNEAVLWGVPIVLIIILSSALWAHTHKYDPYRPLGNDPLDIEVVSLDWKFLFIYPQQGIATLDYLALEQDRPIRLKLTSGTVMQSFMIPQLAGQIYTMAGMTTQLNLLADQEGEYLGRNTQYNGDGFATQSFRTAVMPKSQFDNWVIHTQKNTQTLDLATYEALLKPSIEHVPRYYGTVDAGLFNRVLARFTAGHAHADSTPAEVSQIREHHHPQNNPKGAEQ